MRTFLPTLVFQGILLSLPTMGLAVEWREHRSESGHYVASFPFPGRLAKSDEQVGRGDRIVNIVMGKLQCSFRVSYRPNNTSAQQGVADYRSVLKESPKCRIVGDQEVRLGKYVGHEFRFHDEVDGKAMTGVERTYFVQDRRYYVSVNTVGTEFLDEHNLHRFFNSFWAGTVAEWSTIGRNPPMIKPADIRIVNVDKSAPISYRVAGSVHRLRPGDFQELERETQIDFDRGGAKGTVRATLSAGEYRFVRSDDGTWALQGSDLSGGPPPPFAIR